jgi:glucokinase
MKEKHAIGIDVGGTNTKFGIVNKKGVILVQDRIKTNEHENVEEFIDDLAEKLNPMIEQYGGPEAFLGIGMGAPNANYYQGTIEYAANLKWKGIIPMAELLEQKFKIPAKLTNDANAAAVGEMQYGAAKGMKNFITITLGTGVGSGIIIDGKIVLGHNGFAGELGHVIVRNGGKVFHSFSSTILHFAYSSSIGIIG